MNGLTQFLRISDDIEMDTDNSFKYGMKIEKNKEISEVHNYI